MPARIAFISPTGFGNLGDAAILDSLINGVRRRIPDAEIVGFTQNPRDTEARYGVKAFTCSGLSTETYNVVEPKPVRAKAAATNGHSRKPSVVRRAASLIVEHSRVANAAWQIKRERRHLRLSAERIRGFDFVVVAGGGQLDDFWGGAFGHPYTLSRWSDLAKDAGARFVVLSVGTGRISNRLSARFVRRALAGASYRSFRDARSRELVGDDALTANDPVVPDLAYGLPIAPGDVHGQGAPPPDTPETRLRPLRASRSASVGAIGISPMAYADPRGWPTPDRLRYEAHVASFADLTVRLARAGHDVVLFSTDGQDKPSLDELLERASRELDADARARVRVPQVDGVESLIALLASCEVAVAARLHGVILSHVSGTPALAISHERKVKTLMETMEQTQYCFEIDGFSVDESWPRFLELFERRAAIAADVRARVSGYRKQVEAQYDRVFGAPVS
jgi:polysaccharide pyruvyl transferase WcaK-like protein